MAKKATLTYELTEKQREAILYAINAQNVSKKYLASRLEISETTLDAYLFGQKRIDQDIAACIWGELGESDSLDFLIALQKEPTPVQQSYSKLAAAYFATIKLTFDEQPNERKLEILADLENLVKKYDTTKKQ